MWQVDAVAEARDRIRPYIWKTPLIPSEALGSQDEKVFLKAENLQYTGSFKFRGALHAISRLSDDEKDRGVVVASSGSHGKAVASAARIYGVEATVVLPANPNPTKKRDIVKAGAQIVQVDGTSSDMIARARQLADERGYVFVHAFETPEVFLGQGTIGLEILEDLSDVTTVVAPVGGGGLITGLLVVLKQTNPAIRVIGVQPSGCDSMLRSVKTGHIVSVERANTIAEGLTCVCPEEKTFGIIRDYVDDIVSVTDDQIREAVGTLLWKAHILAEPSGAVTAAALLNGAFQRVPGKTVLIVSGGNAIPRDVVEAVNQE